MKLAVISVTSKGAALAKKLAARLAGDVTLYAKVGRQAGEERTYDSLSELVSEIFSLYEGLIFIMAAGIVVRVIAPYVQDKRFDPAVVVIDDGGQHAVSLLSGHLGGANELTHFIAKAIGAHPVVTTATDVAGKTAPDILARKLEMAIEPFDRLKTVNSVLANGQDAAYYLDTSLQKAAWISKVSKELKITLNDMAKWPIKEEYAAAIFITDKKIAADIPYICLRPKSLVVGVGCRRGASKELILTAIEAALCKIGRSMLSIECIASVDIKQDEEGLLAAGAELGVRLEFFSPSQLAECTAKHKLSVSNFVMNQIGVGNVCEAAALLTAQQHHLVLSKTKYKEVTIAIAEARFS